jgi:methionine synthase II (cobalamin-independent)
MPDLWAGTGMTPRAPKQRAATRVVAVASRASGIGSMPGDDFNESFEVVLGEVGDLPFLPELPARGASASMVGRTLGLVGELGVDLQPAGWRLTDAAGADQRRARSLLAQDLDAVEELSQGRADVFKVQVVGPWTLAAHVERPRGDKAVGDHGARRDLAQALAEGVREHVADVRRRLADASVVVQLDEPALPTVLAGGVPTASGFSRHRSVTAADAAQTLDWLDEAVVSAGATSLVHCCAPEVPVAMLRETSIPALSFDLSLVTRPQYEDLAEWVDAGRALWPGVVPAVDPAGTAPGEVELTNRVLGWWSALGFSEAESLPATVVTPACGLAGASPAWARTALSLAEHVARNLSEGEGRMDP